MFAHTFFNSVDFYIFLSQMLVSFIIIDDTSSSMYLVLIVSKYHLEIIKLANLMKYCLYNYLDTVLMAY